MSPRQLVGALELRADAIVADIGAGPGLFTLPLAAAVPAGRVIATDIRPDVLEIVRARARGAGLPNVETHVVEPDGPGLAPRSIDLAFLCQVDQYLADRAAYLVRLAQTLRSGGRVVIVNTLRFQDAMRNAAGAADLEVVKEWQLSGLYFVMVLRSRHRT